MCRSQLNCQAESGARSGDRRCRYDVADRTGRIVALRRNRPQMRTVLLPLSIAGETCQLDSTLAVLKRIDGVSSACLFFNRTALRIYYHPDRTDVHKILEALQMLTSNPRDYRRLEEDVPRTAMCG